MFKKVVICLDGSKLAEQILPFVQAGAVKFDSKVVLLRVLGVPTAIPYVDGKPPDADIVTEESHQKEAEAGEYLESIAVSLRGEGLNAECVILHKISADEAILNYAADNQVDIIAMTTHGRSGLLRTVLGSVADSVVRKSGLPVMVISPNDIE